MYKKFVELLQKRNESTAQVSRATGIGESVFSNWKNRGGKPSVDNLAKLAKYFDVSIEFFLEEDEV